MMGYPGESYWIRKYSRLLAVPAGKGSLKNACTRQRLTKDRSLRACLSKCFHSIWKSFIRNLTCYTATTCIWGIQRTFWRFSKRKRNCRKRSWMSWTRRDSCHGGASIAEGNCRGIMDMGYVSLVTDEPITIGKKIGISKMTSM